MDDFERMALRRRKPVVAESVEVDRELLADLQTRGLLGDDALEQIKAEKAPNQRASKLVDWLVESKVERAFLEVCSALVTKYPAISKELQTEVRIERGDVNIDEDVMKEAATLVHRKFGTSRRFAETDKKDMTDLIAIKIQLSKEEWRQEMDQVREELSRYVQLCKQKDETTTALDETILRFFKRYQEELVSKAHGMTSTTDIILTSLDDADLGGRLRERLRLLLQRTERLIEERELMVREREKTQRSLDEVNKAISSNNASAAKADNDKNKKEMESRDALIKRLRKMNDSLEAESEKGEKELEELKENSKKQQDRIAELEAKVKELGASKEVPVREKEPVKAVSSVERRAASNSAGKSTGGLSVRGTSTRQSATSATSRKGVGSARK